VVAVVAAVASTRPRRRSWILGVGVDAVTEDEAVRLADDFVRTGGPHQITTVNPEFVMAARKDDRFREIINSSNLATPDGAGLIWAAKLLGQPLRGRVTGVELVQRLCRLARDKSYGVFLLGAEPGVAEAAGAVLESKFPGLKIVGTHAGSAGPEGDDETIALVAASQPDFLFVAYGAPKQDFWISRNQPRLNVPVAIGVGGTFDFLAGKAKRAPRWMRRFGLEWLFRLITEPWRWRRMLSLPRFVFLVSLTKIRSYFG
jgi:N-acetylglucosaminyldiphosphoundecaprenol N-acetyl-beta-D-mannosaminyltransferase